MCFYFVLKSVFYDIERGAQNHHEAMNAGNSLNDLYESTIGALGTVVGLLGASVASCAIYKAVCWIKKRKCF